MTASDPDSGLLPPAGLADRLLTPALLVSLPRVRDNIRCVIDAAGGDPGRWRPHLKTTKMAAVYAELVAAGVRHFKCATTAEAACLLDVRPDADLLVAYPHRQPALARLDALAATHPDARLSVLAEDPADVSEIPGRLGVFVDVNPGMDRTGVPVGKVDRIVAIADAATDRFRGLHYYDGQFHGLDPKTRRTAAHAAYDRLLTVVATLADRGIAVPEIITSGTPTFPDALAHPGFAATTGPVHRVSPGTVVFHDVRSEQELPGFGLRPAAIVLTRVISHPAADRVTCDAGSKSVAAEVGDPCVVVLDHPELSALTPSEEHLPLRVERGAERPARGTLLGLVPAHVCPTVNLHDRAVLLEGDGGWRIVAVDARGHELLAPGSAGGDD